MLLVARAEDLDAGSSMLASIQQFELVECLDFSCLLHVDIQRE